MVEHVCYRCGGRVEEQTPFCPACGAAQIRVSAREPQAPEAQDTASPAPQAAPSASVQSSQAPLGLDISRRVQWTRFLRSALPLAAVAGFFTTSGSTLGWLILLPGSVVLAIYIYRRRQPGPLAVLQGAKMGAFMGLLSFVFFVVFFAVDVAPNPAGYVQNAIHDFATRNPSPQNLQMVQSLFGGTNGVAVFIGMVMVLALVFLLTIDGVSGALAAAFFNKSDKSSL